MRTTLRTGPLIRRLAQAVLHRYPRAWRERYEEEITALIDDTRLEWRDVAELVRGMLAERARELVQSDERPKRTAFVLSAVRFAFGVAFVGSVVAFAGLIRRLTGVLPESTGQIIVLGMLPLFVAFLVVLWRIRRGPPFRPQPPYPAWATFTMLPLWFLLLTVMAWALDWSPRESSILPGWLGYLPSISNLFWLGVVAVGLASGLLPGRQLLFTFSQLTVLEDQLRSARQLVDGCHEMIAKGVPSPLSAAESELDRVTRGRDAARARLYALGYRARLRLPHDTPPGPIPDAADDLPQRPIP